MLSRDDIVEALLDNKLDIFPLSKNSLTGIGYNLSTTYFAFSISKGLLLEVSERTSNHGIEHWIEIPAHDTVLFFTKELVRVNGTLAGTLHSKVSCVCQGLGHISTTLDPTWRGQMIISVNNPTARSVEFNLDRSGGNLLTLLLYHLKTEVAGGYIHDNNSGRCDLLLRYYLAPPKGSECREQYNKIRNFIVGDFAHSLNGDDDYLYAAKISDVYTSKVEQLKKLKARLEREHLFVRDGRCEAHPVPVYHILQTNEEKSLIRGCSLFQLCQQYKQDKIDGLLEKASVTNAAEAEAIEKRQVVLLRIINYELETIEHLRRVEWQNKQILKYVKGVSDVALEREKDRMTEYRRDRWKAWVVESMFLLGVTLVLAWASHRFGWTGEFNAAVVSAMICIVGNRLSSERDRMEAFKTSNRE